MVPLGEIKKIIVHDAIIESITDYIRQSGLAVGERIPSERSLAETLKVSRSSVRGALKALESEGTLEIRHGDGTYLRSLFSPIYYQYTHDHRENLLLLRDLVQAREAIEEWAVVEAARRGEPEGFQALAAMEWRQVKAFTGPAPEATAAREFTLPNMALEVGITRLLGNIVLLDMHERIEKMWIQAYKNLQMTAFPVHVRHKHHMNILAALEKRDETAALAAMQLHNRSLEQHIAAAIEKLDSAG